MTARKQIQETIIFAEESTISKIFTFSRSRDCSAAAITLVPPKVLVSNWQTCNCDKN